MEKLITTPLQYTDILGDKSSPKLKTEKYYRAIMVKSYGGTEYPSYFKIAYLGDYARVTNSNEYRISRNKAVSKVEEELALVENLFEAIYERREAYNMLLDAGKGLLKFLRNWRKPKYWKSLKAGSQPKDLPSAWLAYNFGVMPLIGSIQSACNLLGSEFPVYMVRGASGGSKTMRLENLDSNNAKSIIEEDASYMVELRAYVSPKINPNAALSNVLGITSPLSTLYSVVPWGWAVDYFVNISEILSNFDNKFPGIELVYTWETSYIKSRFWWDYWTRYGSTFYQSGEIVRLERKHSTLDYQLVHSFPTIGSNQAANLFSAIALSMKQPK